jgi:hypothetical protein
VIRLGGPSEVPVLEAAASEEDVMAVAIEMEFAGGTLAQYDAVIGKMGYKNEGPGHPKGLFHIAMQTDTGIRIIDVWESAEAFEEFAANALGPISAEVGAPQPHITATPVYSYLYGPRFAER